MSFLVNLDVPDVDAAARFYGEALGFRIVRRLFDGDVLELERDGARLLLLEAPEGSPAFASRAPHAPDRTYARHWCPVHLDFLVDDLDVALARAVEAGAHLEQPPVAHPYGRIAVLADPYGHGFCLIAMNDRGYDAVEVR